MTCRCTTRGVAARDKAAHAAWHALVVEQGGPAERVDVETLRAARAPAVPVERPDRETRARRYAELKADARRRGAYAEHYPSWARRS